MRSPVGITLVLWSLGRREKPSSLEGVGGMLEELEECEGSRRMVSLV